MVKHILDKNRLEKKQKRTLNGQIVYEISKMNESPVSFIKVLVKKKESKENFPFRQSRT